MLTENGIVKYLTDALASLSSPFAKLVFLTSVRDPYTGHYIHEGWAHCSSPQEVHEMLREAHRIAFESLLELSVVEIARELRRHFESLDQVESSVASLWIDLEPYREMIPQGSPEISRRFFTSQVHLGLELLLCDPEWAPLKEPVASQLQQPDPQPRPQLLN